MTARHFTTASSENITLGLGNLGFTFGPGTVAAVIRLASSGVTAKEILAVGDPAATTATLMTFFVNSGDRPGIFISSVSDVTTAKVLVASRWYLVAISKATGSVAPVSHTYDYVTGGWVHENCLSVAANMTLINSVKLGCYFSSGTGKEFFNGDIAAAAVWDINMSNAQAETLPNDVSLAGWNGLGGLRAMWLLDQNDVTTTVTDLTGGGANETARTGTTVVTDTPNLNYTVPHLPQRMPIGV